MQVAHSNFSGQQAPMPAMRDEAVARLLPDGRRLSLQYGPINLVIEAWGQTDIAYQAAQAHFDGLLENLSADSADVS